MLFEIEGGHELRVKVAVRTVHILQDVWDRISPESTLFPSAGTWKFGAESDGGKDLELSTEAEGKVATLWSVPATDRIRAGHRGEGSFVASGYEMPESSVIEWHVLEVSEWSPFNE
ncbi:hypothetical protein [Streptomyces sp. H72]